MRGHIILNWIWIYHREDAIMKATIVRLFMLSGFLLSVSCSRDEAKFELAEKEFNQGNIEVAFKSYKKFMADYPTSKWRTAVERQIDKCREIISLRDSISRLESDKKFDNAKNLVREIVLLNDRAIDSGKIIARLEEEIRKDEILREQERIEAEEVKMKLTALRMRQEKEYLGNLALFIYSLNIFARTNIAAINDFDNLTEGNNAAFAYAVEGLFGDTSMVKAKDLLSSLYLQIKIPPEKYRACLEEIEKSYRAYKEMISILDNLQNYSRFTLRLELARLANEIYSSINNLEIYLPANMLKYTE